MTDIEPPSNVATLLPPHISIVEIKRLNERVSLAKVRIRQGDEYVPAGKMFSSSPISRVTEFSANGDLGNFGNNRHDSLILVNANLMNDSLQ